MQVKQLIMGNVGSSGGCPCGASFGNYRPRQLSFTDRPTIKTVGIRLMTRPRQLNQLGEWKQRKWKAETSPSEDVYTSQRKTGVIASDIKCSEQESLVHQYITHQRELGQAKLIYSFSG